MPSARDRKWEGRRGPRDRRPVLGLAGANQRRHRVSFEEAVTVFLDPLARLYDDPDHSESESRFLLVGHSLAGPLLLVVHAEKGDTIRIISARRPTARERKVYEADA